MKISIITAVFNNRTFVEGCLRSVGSQIYPKVEHVIVDGGSTDGTVDVIKKFGNHISRWTSEPDKGIYDALNKGILMATGDVIGILHSDDLYAHNRVLEDVMAKMQETSADSCYGDLIYVDRNDTDKVMRYWKSGTYRKDLFERGWMPPHPTFFAKRSVYEKYGLLNLDFPLAADYELMLRFLYRYKISTTYVPEVLVKMRTGGTSNPGLYTLKAVRENYHAWKVNGLTAHLSTFLLKPLSKVLQFMNSHTT